MDRLGEMQFHPFEEEVWKVILGNTVYIFGTQPFTTLKTLMHLGYEPFPGRYNTTFRGNGVYFLPNIISYGRQLCRLHGIRVLYTGCDSLLAARLVMMFVRKQTAKYIDHLCPTLAKAPFDTKDGLDERQITDIQSLERFARRGLRETITVTVAIVVTRPFIVVAIRQIAQLVGGESMYTGCIQGLLLIAREEGMQGLFAGIIPRLALHWFVLWGSAFYIYTMERILVRSGIDQATDADPENRKQGEESLKAFRTVIRAVVPAVLTQRLRTFSIVSTIIACVGSGLAVSFLPYNSPFNSWQECFAHHRPLHRGNVYFRRIR